MRSPARSAGPTRRDVLKGAAATAMGLALGAAATPVVAEEASEDGAASLRKRGWALTMHDEFEGPALDTSIWVPRYLGFRMPPDVGNAQYRFESSAIVLSVTADTPPFGSKFSRPKEQVSSIQTAQGDYNQGSFVTDHYEPPIVKFAQQYGYFEIRAKGQRDFSGHSAFWLNTADPDIFARGDRPGSPNALEVDVFEAGRGDVYATTVLTPGTPFTVNYGTYPFTISDDFHVYAMEWTQDAVYIYVDGQLVHTHDGRRVIAAPMFVYLSLYTNSQFGNSSAPRYPAEFSIDYIRAYRRDPNLGLAGTTVATDRELTVAFEVGQSVSRAVVQGAHPRLYDVQVSPDGSTRWTTVATNVVARRLGGRSVLDFPRQTGVRGVRLLSPGGDEGLRNADLAFTDTYLVDQRFDDEAAGAAPMGWVQRRVGGSISIEDQTMAISRTASSSVPAVAEKGWPAIRGQVAISARVESDAADTSARLPAVIGADGSEIAAIVLDRGQVTAVAGGKSRQLSDRPYVAGTWHDVQLVVDTRRRLVVIRYDDRVEVLRLRREASSAGVRFALDSPGAKIHVSNVVAQWLDALLGDPGEASADG